MATFELVILWLHLLSAIFLVGGSLFFWAVVMPIFSKGTEDEASRTLLVGRLAKRYGRLINWTLLILITTGVYNLTWYLGGISIIDPASRFLLTKVILVVLLVFFIYYNNLVYGRKIVRCAKEGKIDELQRLRKKGRAFSMLNIGLMLLITLISVFLRAPIR